ncbi:MAG: hypothetical protein M3Y60_07840 [Bacteroidota bacterium]|nr:hypothetical protein [Bacteroidota bacterium]
MMNKIILVGLLASFSAGAQTFTEKISRQLSFEKQSTDNAFTPISHGLKIFQYR